MPWSLEQKINQKDYSGYFTCFEDAASDIEPIAYLYKNSDPTTGKYLKVPEKLLTNPLPPAFGRAD